jgi:hypothetical protein
MWHGQARRRLDHVSHREPGHRSPDSKELAMIPGATAALTVTAAAAALLGAAVGPATVTGQGASAPAAQRAVRTVTLNLEASTPKLRSCFPHARSRVTVALTTDAVGKDSFTIQAWGLRPSTGFTVFLIEKAGSPFGAVEYIGDFTTDKQGRALNVYHLIVEEAFAFNNVSGLRRELNSVGFWFADPKDDNGCLGGKSPVTQFDGDGSAGVQMMNSGKHRLP